MRLFRTLPATALRNLLFLFATSLCFWTSLTALLPILPSYIQDATASSDGLGGASDGQVGLVMGCFAIGLLLSREQLGIMADRQGRKIVMLVGMAVVGLAPVGYALTQSVPLLALLRGFHGISVAAFTTGYPALVVDLAPPQRKGELLGLMTLAMPLGMTMGPALGGFLQPEIGYANFFLLLAGLATLGLLLASQIREARVVAAEPAPRQRRSLRDSLTEMWQGLMSPRMQTPATVLLLIGMTFGALVSFFPLFLRQSELDLNPGLFYTVSAMGNFSSRFLAGRASDRFGRGVFITISISLYALSMFLLMTATSPQGVLLAAVFQGIGGGTLIPMVLALMSDRSLAEERGRVYSLSFVGHDVGMGLAGPIFGPLTSFIGYRGLFGLGGVFSLGALGIFLTRSSKDVPESFRFATGRGADAYAIEP